MDARIAAIIVSMESDIARRQNLRALAARCHLSLSRFCHLFKAETGYSPAVYLKRLRMQAAYRLLCDSPLPLKRIVYQNGLGDRSHFARDFKELHGHTPIALRRQKRSK